MIRNMRRLLKSIALVSFFLVFSKLFYIALAVVMSRKLGVEGVGTYGFILSVIGLAFMFIGIGHGVAVRDTVSDIKNWPKYFWNFLYLRAAMSLFTIVFIFIITCLYPFSSEIRNALYIMCIAVLFSIPSRTISGAFYALRQLGKVFLIEFTGDAVTVGSASLFILSGKGLMWVFVGFAIGEATSMVISIILVHKAVIGSKFIKPNFYMLKNFAKKGFYFILQAIIKLGMFQTDMIVLAFFEGTVLTGYYNAAYKLSFSADILSAAIAFVMYPLYAARYEKSAGQLIKDYATAAVYNFATGTIAYIFLVISADIAIFYIYGPAFEHSAGLVRILAIAIIFSSLNSNNSAFLNAIRKERLNAFLAFIAFSANAFFDIMLVGPYGMKGVAFATVICSLAYFVASTAVIIKERRKLKNELKIKPKENLRRLMA